MHTELMQVTTTIPTSPLFAGAAEVWVEVSGPDPLPNFSTIRLKAEEQLGFRLMAQPVRYYPSWDGPTEPYREFWICRRLAVS